MIIEHHKNTQLLDEDIEVVHENVKYSEIDDEDIYLKSVVRTRGRTEKMLRLIDKSMQSLKRQMEEKDKLNRYEAADLVYFRKMSFEDAAKQLNCDPKTVRRWKNEVVRELSGLMFGIDGFDLDF